MALPTDGIYRIETAMDTALCLDVANESLSNQANLMIFGQNEGVSYAGNHQRFRLLTNGSHKQLQACHSGKMLEVYGKTARPQDGDNVSQYTSNGGDNQKWTLADATASDGYARHIIKSVMDERYVIDASGAIAKPSTNVMVNQSNDGDNQKWVFVRDSFYYKEWSVPTGVGLSTTKTGAPATTIALTGGKGTVYPAWACDGDRFQLRFRDRGRNKGKDTWSAWTAWREPSGSTANGGWGDPWTTDVVDASPGTLNHLATGIAIDLGASYDKLQYQFEVQRFEPDGFIGNIQANGPIHGGSAAGTVDVVARPNIAVSKIAFAPDGLRIAYASDFERGGNRIDSLSVTCAGKVLASGFQARDMPAAGTITIPFSELAFVPSEGEMCSIGFNYRTIDTAVWVSKSLAVAYDASHGLALTPTFTDSDGFSVLAKLTGYTTSACYLQTGLDGKVRFSACEQVSAGTFRVLPPFGKPYTLFFVGQNGASWGTLSVDMLAIAGARSYVWNWEGGGWCQIAYNSELSSSLERDFEAVQTNGRPRESVFFGDGSSGSVAVKGAILVGDGLDHGSMEDFERLAACGHAVFREPSGKRREVAVTSTDYSVELASVRSVSVSMKEHA